MWAYVDGKTGILSIHLSSTWQAIEDVEEHPGSPLLASSAEFRVPALLGITKTTIYSGQVQALHFGAVLMLLRMQLFHLLRDLQMGPLYQVPSKGVGLPLRFSW